MKKIVLLGFALFYLFTSAGLAAEIPKGLIDSKPDQAILINLDEWYKTHPSPGKPGIVGETVFTSPRSVVMIRTAGKGTVVGTHFHSTTDEMVLVIGGSGELLINGKWTPVKAGDIHVLPRGNVHDTRSPPNEDLRFVSVFTPSLPPGADLNMVPAGTAAQIPKGLIDSKPDQGIIINLDEWYKTHPSPVKPELVSETVFASPRSVLMIRTAGKGRVSGSHYHSTSDEIVFVVGGSGELLINGKWTPVKAGDIHVNPRGNIHDTRSPNEDLRYISIFAPQQPPGGDVNTVKD
jgi:mannose-6-phosphate isomerase-like protein (cupin superfamily)